MATASPTRGLPLPLRPHSPGGLPLTLTALGPGLGANRRASGPTALWLSFLLGVGCEHCGAGRGEVKAARYVRLVLSVCPARCGGDLRRTRLGAAGGGHYTETVAPAGWARCGTRPCSQLGKPHALAPRAPRAHVHSCTRAHRVRLRTSARARASAGPDALAQRRVLAGHVCPGGGNSGP